MGLALLSVTTLAQPFCALLRWWSVRKQPALTRADCTALTETGTASLWSCQSQVYARKAIQAPSIPARTRRSAEEHASPSCNRLGKPFPLRVLHAHGSGRMAIAGRMADVCAELDRLVAIERMH